MAYPEDHDTLRAEDLKAALPGAPFPFEFLPGESIADRWARLVNLCAGFSLSNQRDKLTALVGRGVDDPAWAAQVVEWETNCAEVQWGLVVAMFGSVEAARAFDPRLTSRSVNTKSMAVLISVLSAAKNCFVQVGGVPGGGARIKGFMIAHYRSIPYRMDAAGHIIYDDHVEAILADPDPKTFVAEHGGGGRKNNEITVESGDVRWSVGRPCAEVYDLSVLPFPPSPPLPDDPHHSETADDSSATASPPETST